MMSVQKLVANHAGTLESLVVRGLRSLDQSPEPFLDLLCSLLSEGGPQLQHLHICSPMHMDPAPSVRSSWEASLKYLKWTTWHDDGVGVLHILPSRPWNDSVDSRHLPEDCPCSPTELVADILEIRSACILAHGSEQVATGVRRLLNSYFGPDSNSRSRGESSGGFPFHVRTSLRPQRERREGGEESGRTDSLEKLARSGSYWRHLGPCAFRVERST
jgi:hypothetical protein